MRITDTRILLQWSTKSLSLTNVLLASSVPRTRQPIACVHSVTRHIDVIVRLPYLIVASITLDVELQKIDKINGTLIPVPGIPTVIV